MTQQKYEKFVFTDCLEKPNLPGHTNAKMKFAFRGDRQIPGANSNFGWNVYYKPMLLEKAPHTHDADEYLIFLGHDPTDWEGSFAAEIDLYMGDEEEYYLINRPTTVFIPRGMPHTPLNFRVLNKPVLFGVILETPRFVKAMDGKEYAYDGPGVNGNPETLDLDKMP